MKLLTVCLGNICRSPIAEEVLRSKLNQNFIVDSAGLISFHKGNPPDKRAILVCQEMGLDISLQKSRPITEADLLNFDIIYCMDESVYENVLNMSQNTKVKSKIKLFLEEAYGKRYDNNVKDPYYGDIQDFREVFQVIEHAAEKIAKKIIDKIENIK